MSLTDAFRATIDQGQTDVPCNGCVRCCQKQLVIVSAEYGDDVASYETFPMPTPVGFVEFLMTKPNGDCVYLDRLTGCTIHDRAPAICRAFDCRLAYLAAIADSSRKQRRAKRRDPTYDAATMREGRKRVASLNQGERP